MEEVPSHNALLDVIAALSSRRESGRLQITSGATRGAFFFKNGKLVDARMGPFTGFPAINLAVSVTGAHLDFDPSIQPVSPSFNPLTEPYIRRMVRERFAIEIDEAEVSEQEKEEAGDESALIPTSPHMQDFHSSSASDSQELQTEVMNVHDSGVKILPPMAGNAVLAKPDTAASEMKPRNSRNILASFSRSFRVLLPPASLVYSTREKVAVGSILLIIIVTAVSIASSFIKGKRTLAVNASPPPATQAQSGSIVTPAGKYEEEKPLEVGPGVKARRPIAQPSPFETFTPSPSNDTNPLPANVPTGYEIGTPLSKPAVRADEKSLAKPPFRSIAVVIQVDAGHVAEAYIQNPQAGLEASEATALRLARQRRFPEGTKGTQTMVVRVASGPIKEAP